MESTVRAGPGGRRHWAVVTVMMGVAGLRGKTLTLTDLVRRSSARQGAVAAAMLASQVLLELSPPYALAPRAHFRHLGTAPTTVVAELLAHFSARNGRARFLLLQYFHWHKMRRAHVCAVLFTRTCTTDPQHALVLSVASVPGVVSCHGPRSSLPLVEFRNSPVRLPRPRTAARHL